MSAIAAFHVIWVPHKLAEAPYMGVLFIALSVGAVLTASLLIVADSRLGRLGWGAAAAVAVAPLGGYVLSRTVELPQQAGLAGDWAAPLGIPSLVAEGVLLVLAAARLPARHAAMVTAARTAAVIAVLALALPAPPLVSAHGEEGSDQSEQRSAGDARGDAEGGGGGSERAGGSEPGGGSERGGGFERAGGSERAHGEPPPSPTPAYTVIPASVGAALLTVGGVLVLGRRGALDHGRR